MFRHFVVAFMFASAVTASAQDVCTELVRHGIYDHYRQTSANLTANQIQSSICDAYSSYERDAQAGHIGASYGLFSGSASISADKLAVIGKQMCSASSSSSMTNDQLTTITDTVSAAAMAGFRECVQRYSDGLRTTTQFNESDQRQVTIDARWVAPIGSATSIKVKGITYIPPAGGLTCTGPLQSLAVTHGGGVLGNVSSSMSCFRDIKANPFDFQGRRVYAEPATVVVMTDGGPITRTLEAVPAGPPPVPLTVPVGGIIAFSGTMQQAEAETQNGWWVCDGRSVDDGQSPLNSKATPNLVDKFVRGSNDPNKTGGADSFGIPAQTIDSHTYGFGPPIITQDPRLVVAGGLTWPTGSSIHSQGTWNAVTIPTLPSYYSLIYLIRAR